MKSAIAAAAAAVIVLAGCGSSPQHHKSAASTQPPPSVPPAATTPAAAPATPACDVGLWLINDQPATETGTLDSDLQQIETDLNLGDPTAVAADGHQLAEDSISDEHTPPPACAKRLHQAWKEMLLWYGLAGLAIYITGARPDLTNHNYALAGRDIKRGLRYWEIVKPYLG
jgi:outer membrane murein-binding lipoprotein Lpp